RPVIGRESFLQPAKLEELAPRALGRSPAQERFVEQSSQERFVGAPCRRPSAILVEMRPDVLARPAVEQYVARTAIEPDRGPTRRKPSHVADAADVDHGACLALVAKDRFVECRNERRTLAASRHVAPTKVG